MNMKSLALIVDIILFLMICFYMRDIKLILMTLFIFPSGLGMVAIYCYACWLDDIDKLIWGKRDENS